MIRRLSYDVSDEELAMIALVQQAKTVPYRHSLEFWLDEQAEDAARECVLRLVREGRKLLEISELAARGEIEIGRPSEDGTGAAA